MPDFKLTYIMDNGPWVLDEVGIVNNLHDENTFHKLPTGHFATEFDVLSDAVTFFAPIQYDDVESDEEYYSCLFLEDIDGMSERENIPNRVTDVSTAYTIGEPAMWTEPVGDVITISHNGEEQKVLDTIWLYEFIPVSEDIESVMDLRNTLEDITGEPVYGINVS
jgi:hypothetical protein